MAYNIGMISLGCPKNQVDAEQMLFRLREAGFELTHAENQADIIIVNTCGFIEDAKQESIDNILEVSAHKADGRLKAVIVTGCLAERYAGEIRDSLPEADVIVPLGANGDIVNIVRDALRNAPEKAPEYSAEKLDLPLCGGRILTTPPYTAYVKIADGCDNCCSYCAIPMIRGSFRSRPCESIVQETRGLTENGVREIILVAQDTTRYGEDLYGECRLTELLEELENIPELRWIRILYTYPERITEKLIEYIAKSEKVLPYLDIPIQHCSGEILRRMNRPGDAGTLRSLIIKLREKIPGITLRTTLITGFPGETEEQFTELAEFVREIKFDRLGCFPYSEEEGTPAAEMPEQIEPQLRHDRAGIIMADQMLIAEALNQAKIGREYTVVTEGYDNYIKHYFGRSEAEAPEIDGKIFFSSKRRLKLGEFVNVKITDTLDYDLLGEYNEHTQ